MGQRILFLSTKSRQTIFKIVTTHKIKDSYL